MADVLGGGSGERACACVRVCAGGPGEEGTQSSLRSIPPNLTVNWETHVARKANSVYESGEQGTVTPKGEIQL